MLSFLKTNKAHIGFIQETHMNEGEAAKFKTGWVGPVFQWCMLLKEVKDTPE